MKSTWLTVWVVAAVAFLPLTHAKPDEPGKAPTPVANPLLGKEPGDVRDDNGLKMKLVWCPPGVVTMENVEYLEVITEVAAKEVQPSDDDFDAIDEAATAPQPRRTEKITPVKAFLKKGYWLGKCEVTQSEWKRIMQTEPWMGQRLTKDGADFPATFVDWNDATEFCQKLTQHERQAGRLPNDWEYTLPTEAQWERACRAGTKTKFSFGDDESKLGEYAWFDENAGDAGEAYAHRVGQKNANPWGLFDMHGNVAEWCRDSHLVRLTGGIDPEDRAWRSRKTTRGGSWNFVACRSAARGGCPPDARAASLGFRVALSSIRQTHTSESETGARGGADK